MYDTCILCVFYVYQTKKTDELKGTPRYSLCIPPALFGHSFLYIPCLDVLKVYSGDTYSCATGDCMGETRVPLQ